MSKLRMNHIVQLVKKKQLYQLLPLHKPQKYPCTHWRQFCQKKNIDVKTDASLHSENELKEDNENEEYTPKLFSEEQNIDDQTATEEIREKDTTEELFEQDTSEDEDFEIPAFLRRQKF